MTWPLFMLIFFALELVVCIPLAAYLCGPILQKMLSFVWEDPTIKQQAAVIQRMKELCVDSNVPEEAAKLMVSKELNITEECIAHALEGLDMATIKCIMGGKGGIARLFLGQLSRSLKGFKGGL